MVRSTPGTDALLNGRSHRAADIVLVTGLVALGTGLRFYRLDAPLWLDEMVTLLNFVRLPLQEIVTEFPGDNNHPLYSVLGHMAVGLLGESPWALRLPAVLFGIAAIPMLYYLGVAVATRVEAGAAAAILTVSYHHVWFSQNARGYTALLFLTLLSTFALLRWLSSGRRSWLILYGLAVAAGCYAHLSMVLVCVSQAIACAIGAFVQRDRSRASTEWRTLAVAFIGSGLLSGLLFSPMLLDVATSLAAEATSPETASESLWTAVRAAVGGLQVGFGTIWGIVAATIIFGAGAWNFFRRRPVETLLFLLPLPVVLLSTLAMDRPVRPRFVFFAMGSVLLVTMHGAASIGSSLARMTRGKVAPYQGGVFLVGLVTLAAVVTSIASLPYGYRYPKQDYARAVAFVEDAKSPDDVVAAIGDPAAIPVRQYFGKSWERVDHAPQLRKLRTEATTVWVIYTFPSAIESGLPDLWATLLDCAVVGEFEGTVDDGTISVRRCQ